MNRTLIGLIGLIYTDFFVLKETHPVSCRQPGCQSRKPRLSSLRDTGCLEEVFPPSNEIIISAS
jgi:hypothetical protein